MTEKEAQTVRDSVYFRLIGVLKNSEKKTYTKEELIELIMTIGLAKDQEN